jgi:hypothetical protein
MAKKRRKKRMPGRRPARSRRPSGGPSLVTPEGDALAFVSARYQHDAPAEIRQVLAEMDDFDLDDQTEVELDGSVQFAWFETRADAPSLFAPIGRRILANLTLTATTLEVEAMSQQRLNDCCQRLEDLLGDRIQLAERASKSVAQALRESEPRSEPEAPFIPPPEVIAQLEEQMLRQWIDESIPALGGLTPRQAVKTPEGRRQVLELIEHATQMQRRMKKVPGMFAPDYRKVKKMLGLE